MSEPASGPLRVAVVAEGAVWGGIESHLRQLLGAVDWRTRGIEPSAWLLSAGALEEELRRSTLRIERPPRPGGAGTLAWLRGGLSALRPHVIHAHGLVPEVLGALLAGGAGRGPLMATVHSDPGAAPWAAPGRSRVASGALYLARRLRARCLVAVSADIRERLLRLRFDPERIALVYNGVPPAEPGESAAAAALRQSLGIAPHAVVAGMIGRLEPVKGHARALRVLAMLREQTPDLHLLVAGDGPLRDAIADQVRRLGLGHRVHCLGFRRDGGAVMSALDVGLFASDHEGIPFAALEMMIRGVPLVCFAVGGLREIVSDGETGCLVPPFDERAYAARLSALAADAEHRRLLGGSASRSVAARFSIDRMIAETARLWQTVAARDGARAAQGTSRG